MNKSTSVDMNTTAKVIFHAHQIDREVWRFLNQEIIRDKNIKEDTCDCKLCRIERLKKEPIEI